MKVLILAVMSLLIACGGDDNPNNASSSNNANNSNNDNNQNNVNNSNNVNNANNVNNVNNTNSGTLSFVATTVSTDFASSRYMFVTIDLATGEVVGTPEAVDYGSGDVAVSVSGGAAFVIDRGSFPSNDGVVTMFDLTGDRIGDFEVGENPRDVVAVEGSIFVTQYNQGTVAVFSENDGEFTEDDLIDLTGFDDDQNPDPDAMIVDGLNVLVVMQKLTNFAGVEDSCVVVIDGSSKTIIDQDPDSALVDAVCLDVKNAWAGITPFGAGFAVGGIGTFGALDSGITTLSGQDGLYAAGTQFLTEQTLGGDLWSFAVDDDRALAVVDVAGVPTMRVSELENNVWTETDEITLGTELGSPVATQDGFTVVGIRDPASPGFEVYDAVGELIGQWSTEYLPYDIALIP